MVRKALNKLGEAEYPLTRVQQKVIIYTENNSKTLPKRGDTITGRECVYKEAGSAVQFRGFFDLFPNCCTGLFSGTGQTALFLAVGGKLLFLYVLECEVYPADPGNDDCNVGLRQADPQVRQVEEAAFDILPCVQPWCSVFL